MKALSEELPVARTTEVNTKKQIRTIYNTFKHLLNLLRDIIINSMGCGPLKEMPAKAEMPEKKLEEKKAPQSNEVIEKSGKNSKNAESVKNRPEEKKSQEEVSEPEIEVNAIKNLINGDEADKIHSKILEQKEEEGLNFIPTIAVNHEVESQQDIVQQPKDETRNKESMILGIEYENMEGGMSSISRVDSTPFIYRTRSLELVEEINSVLRNYQFVDEGVISTLDPKLQQVYSIAKSFHRRFAKAISNYRWKLFDKCKDWSEYVIPLEKTVTSKTIVILPITPIEVWIILINA